MPKEIPSWAKQILADRAGEENSLTGVVMQALAEILTPYQEFVDEVRGYAEGLSMETDEEREIGEYVLEMLDEHIPE